MGLNPHNGEFRKNSEEVRIIIPAISSLKKKGINLKGPLVCDTSFVINHKKYDVIVGMYHDQVLTPFKTLFHYDAINLTLGFGKKQFGDTRNFFVIFNLKLAKIESLP